MNGESEAQRVCLTHHQMIVHWGCAESSGCRGYLLKIQVFSARVILALGSGLRWAKPEIEKANNLWGMSCCDNISQRKARYLQAGILSGSAMNQRNWEANWGASAGPVNQAVSCPHALAVWQCSQLDCESETEARKLQSGLIQWNQAHHWLN